MTSRKHEAHEGYTELGIDQVRQTVKDALRQQEHGHLQAVIQQELAEATENPAEAHADVAARQVRDYEAQIKLLRAKLAALPGE